MGSNLCFKSDDLGQWALKDKLGLSKMKLGNLWTKNKSKTNIKILTMI